jgi:hypothetical protein
MSAMHNSCKIHMNPEPSPVVCTHSCHKWVPLRGSQTTPSLIAEYLIFWFNSSILLQLFLLIRNDLSEQARFAEGDNRRLKT